MKIHRLTFEFLRLWHRNKDGVPHTFGPLIILAQISSLVYPQQITLMTVKPTVIICVNNAYTILRPQNEMAQ